MVLITDLMKYKAFLWTDEAEDAFVLIKKRLNEPPCLALPNFNKLFEVESNASEIGISVVLSQCKQPIAFFNEKLSGSSLNYNTYDAELMVIVKAFQYWCHNLISKELVLYTDYEALKY